MALAQVKLPIILFGAAQLLKFAVRRNAEFGARVKQHNLVAQIMTRDEEIGRWYGFDNGKVTTGAGLHAKPDIKLMFKNAAVGVSLLTPPINWLDQINAQKDFVLTVEGPDALTNWFAQTLMMAQSAGLKYGTKMRDGTTRRSLMPMSVNIPTCTFAAMALIHSATGTKLKKMITPTMISAMSISVPKASIVTLLQNYIFTAAFAASATTMRFPVTSTTTMDSPGEINSPRVTTS